LAVDLIVGDLDSVSAEGLAYYESLGVPVDRHPTAKDRSDLELALDAALAQRPDRVLVLGIGGGRLDHFLANILVLAGAAGPGRLVEAVTDETRLVAFADRAVLRGNVGDTVSLLAPLGQVEGIVTSGLHYPLRDEALLPGTARGLSNILTAPEATIEVRRGSLLALQPQPSAVQEAIEAVPEGGSDSP
jgi:thiamine pyrophosphokinase